MRPPERIADDHHKLIADLAFLIGERATQLRLHPRDPEEGGRHGHAVHTHRRAVLVDTAVTSPDQRLLVEYCDVTETVEVIGNSRTNRLMDPRTWIHVPGRHYAIGFGHPERLQEHTTHDREERRVGADAHGQSQ